jgi:hypothetical protein
MRLPGSREFPVSGNGTHGLLFATGLSHSPPSPPAIVDWSRTRQHTQVKPEFYSRIFEIRRDEDFSESKAMNHGNQSYQKP